jgi:hypothetical protein
MDDKTFKKGIRNAWILTGLGILYIVTTVALAIWSNTPARPARWDMDGTKFVPASSPQAEGYYHAGEGANPVAPGVHPTAPAYNPKPTQESR